jgi:serine/threonine protein kinase
LSEAPRPPSEINPAISPELDDVVLHALERDPNQRYATAQGFAYSLSHPTEARVRDLRVQPPEHSRSISSYLMFALIPVVLLALLLYVARAG